MSVVLNGGGPGFRRHRLRRSSLLHVSDDSAQFHQGPTEGPPLAPRQEDHTCTVESDQGHTSRDKLTKSDQGHNNSRDEIAKKIS
jgi:hypothetical protein